MNAKTLEARRAYKRNWAKNNPEKIKAQQERYWNKKAEEAATSQQEKSREQSSEPKESATA